MLSSGYLSFKVFTIASSVKSTALNFLINSIKSSFVCPAGSVTNLTSSTVTSSPTFNLSSEGVDG